MPVIDEYWLDDHNAPYATLLNILQSHVHPETDQMDELQESAKLTDHPKMQTFKRELREVIADPSVLPDGALFTATGYEDGTDEAFLSRLWRELYGGETP